ncbi:hypothetical protein F5Y03DRAFT_377942 [Xylaria venustula]|nr:hypothetical protein F5Y03DRAFT_377942 [Xylaria venustula]
MSTPPESAPGLQIITGSFFRMGTQSLAEAYRILGYRAHHGLDDILANPWDVMERAAEAKWPLHGSQPSRPALTRSDWDVAWGSFDAVADLASPFTIELADAYPDAKVIVVQRDFDSWWESFKSENIDTFFNPRTAVLSAIGTYVFRLRSGPALQKTYFGFFDANSAQEIEAHARRAYNQHFKSIREAIPPHRRLEYQLGSGWEPLCTFLGKSVPDVKFPYVNKRHQHQEKSQSHLKRLYMYFLNGVAPWILAGGLTALTAYYLSKR